MLKQLYLNGRAVPVPVPLITLGQALAWVESTLVLTGQSITRIMVDGRELSDEIFTSPSITQQQIRKDTRLEVQVESALDLADQLIEAVRNFSGVLLANLKPLAVHAWQTPPKEEPAGLSEAIYDLSIIQGLIDQTLTLVLDPEINLGVLGVYKNELRLIREALASARSQRDWKASAKTLLNRLEPELERLNIEGSSLQSMIFTMRSRDQNQNTYAAAASAFK